VYYVLCTEKFVEDLGSTSNCTGRSVIDDPMFDSGLYSYIDSIRFFKCKFDLKNQFLYD
jgi:hypothetical protein